MGKPCKYEFNKANIILCPILRDSNVKSFMANALKLLYLNRSGAVVIEEAPNGALNLFVSFL
jgi:hypothetical protein